MRDNGRSVVSIEIGLFLYVDTGSDIKYMEDWLFRVQLCCVDWPEFTGIRIMREQLKHFG